LLIGRSLTPPTKRIAKGRSSIARIKGPSKNQLAAEKTGQGYRIATPIKQIDEDRNVYDLTRTLMEEMIFFPFSPKDDLVDAVSRVFDLEPRSPNPHEAGMLETPVFEDS
jgi:phage terminase large subunit-like protein